ncbi:PCYCGC domain-containing protein [Paenibacillus sp. MZ04-78.2]|uniref:PCYCGC domain-containing protein n=1 Tax=Paenibacillus sp. MZ04-78.2 TaxID=2962034 RepID=UPI0020B714CC|nr:PCYCGC domain-containing protein [Paenibacillus sp. MZ04-78.2]MCP3775597.1 PCYCGC domain-containing protein [Paenibacillus sp. MZ04-78.2]
MFRRTTVILALTALLLILSACGGSKAAKESHVLHKTPSGDLQEKTASLTTLPSFLDKQPEQMKKVYMIAAQTKDLLRNIPCYCGCGENAGHQSNTNCFIKETASDGSVVWDDHATRCGVCLETAVKSAQLQQQGQSAKHIREQIDKQYQKGFAKPTPTPLPS